MRRYRSRGVARALSVPELRHMARRRLPEVIFEILEGGAEDEITLARNRSAFERIAFLPAALRDVGAVDIRTSLFGQEMTMPVVVAPTGFNGLLWPKGDIALARAAASAGLIMTQSSASNASVEEVGATEGLRHWMQLYVFRSEEFMEQMIQRAADAGCEALVVTVDANIFGNREWDRRNYRSGSDPSLMRKLEALLHPGWMRDVMLPGIPSFGNVMDFLPAEHRHLTGAMTWTRGQIDPTLSWRHLDRIRAMWKGPLLVKGLLRADDTMRARDAGADGVVMSNHGGRQLDGAVSALEALPDVRRAVGQDFTLLIDGGVRRGADVIKALALGADAVMAGRAGLYGLAAGGEAGAARALAILAEEMHRVMGLLGATSVSELGADYLWPAPDAAGG